MNATDKLRQGAQAKQLMADLMPYVERVRARIFTKIEQSTFDEGEQREDAYRMLRAITSAVGEIELDIRTATGIAAEMQEAERQTVRRVVEHKRGQP